MLSIRTLFKAIMLSGALLVWLPGLAAIAQKPLFLSQGAAPLVMMGVSLDHQLFKKAYPDHTDLDGDGRLETSYTDAIDYYGYFDENKCYLYSSGRFQPTATVVSGTYSHFCDTTEWSGNFLNWATMTRIDVLRKILYGGKRKVDTSD